MPKNIVCAYLEQIPKYPEDIKAIGVLQSEFDEVHRIESEMHLLEEQMQVCTEQELKKILAIYSQLVQQFETKGGYEVDEKLNRICKGLQFSEDFLNRNFNLLSGGQKTTVILGKLLIDNPDILLLDEPTNHLDTVNSARSKPGWKLRLSIMWS